MGRATVVVESSETALREAGDVVLAIREGTLAPDSLVTLADLIAGGAVAPADRPLVVKTCGMAWQDLVVAVAAHRRKGERRGSGGESEPGRSGPGRVCSCCSERQRLPTRPDFGVSARRACGTGPCARLPLPGGPQGPHMREMAAHVLLGRLRVALDHDVQECGVLLRRAPTNDPSWERSVSPYSRERLRGPPPSRRVRAFPARAAGQRWKRRSDSGSRSGRPVARRPRSPRDRAHRLQLLAGGGVRVTRPMVDLDERADLGVLVQVALGEPSVTRSPLLRTASTRPSRARSSMASRTGVAETPYSAARVGAE